MHARNFGCHVTVRPSARPPVLPSAPQGNQREMICFPVSSLQPVFNMMINVDVMVILATRTFRKRKTTTTTKPSLNRERARARDKTKNKNKKKSNLKMEMINFSGQYGENERQWKRKRAGTQETKLFVRTWDVPSKKRVTRKFHAVVVQDNDKEMQKRSVLHVQSCCCFCCCC